MTWTPPDGFGPPIETDKTGWTPPEGFGPAIEDSKKKGSSGPSLNGSEITTQSTSTSTSEVPTIPLANEGPDANPLGLQGSTPFGLKQEDGGTVVADTQADRKKRIDNENRAKRIEFLKQKTLDNFKNNQALYADPKNRDIYYNTLLKYYKPEDVAQIIGNDKWKDEGGGLVTTTYRPNPITGENDLLKQEGDAYKRPFNVIGESAGEGMTQGAKRIKEVTAEPIRTPEDVAKMLIGVGRGTTEAAMGGANLIIPQFAAFTLGMKQAEDIAPAVGTAMAPVETALQKHYQDKGEAPPAWMNDGAALSDFVWNILIFKGLHETGKAITSADVTKAINEMSPSDMDAVASKISKTYQESPEAPKLNPEDTKISELSDQADVLKADLEKVKGTPAEPVIAQKIQDINTRVDELHNKQAEDHSAEATMLTTLDNLQQQRDALVKSKEGLSPEAQAAIDPAIAEVDKHIESVQPKSEWAIGDIVPFHIGLEKTIKSIKRNTDAHTVVDFTDGTSGLIPKNKTALIEQMSKKNISNLGDNESGVSESPSSILSKYNEGSDKYATIEDVVDGIDEYAKENNDKKLMEAVDAFRRDQEYNRSIGERGDAEQMEREFIQRVNAATGSDIQEADIHEHTQPEEIKDFTDEEIQKAYADREKELSGMSKLSYKEQFIHDNWPRIKRSDFEHYGDRNWIVKGEKKNGGTARRMSLLYFSDKAMPLDVRAQEMSERAGVEITPQDIVDYIMRREMEPEIFKKKSTIQILNNAAEIPHDAAKIIADYAKNGNNYDTVESVEAARGFPLSDEHADIIIDYLKNKDNEKATNNNPGEGLQAPDGTANEGQKMEAGAEQPVAEKPASPPVEAGGEITPGGPESPGKDAIANGADQAVGEPVAELKTAEPIRQLGTGANVYFESKKYRVNDDTKNGGVILNVGDRDSEIPIANIEFKNPNEAIFVAKKLQESAPDGLASDYHNVDAIVNNLRDEYKSELERRGVIDDKKLNEKTTDNAKENGTSASEGGQQEGTNGQAESGIPLRNNDESQKSGEDQVGDGGVIGIRHNDIDQQRAEMGLPLMEKQPSQPAEQNQEAGRKIFESENMDYNVHEWSKPGTTLNNAEQRALQLHIADLEHRHDYLYSLWEKANKSGDESATNLRSQLLDLWQRLDNAHRVAKDIRSEAGRVLGDWNWGVDKDMTFVKMMEKARVLENKNDISPEMEAKIREISLKYEEANKKLEAALKENEEKDAKIAAQEKLLKEKRRIEREEAGKKKESRHKSLDEKLKESEDRKAKLKERMAQLLKESRGKMNDIGSAVKDSVEMADIVKDIVNENIKQAFEAGKVVLEDVIDKTVIDLKEFFDDVRAIDIMKIYSDYGKPKERKLSDYAKAKAEIKSQSYYKSGTSEAQEGKPPYKRTNPSKESLSVRAARQEMEEAMKADGIQWDSRPIEQRRKSALEKTKQTLLNTISDINNAIENNKMLDRKRDVVVLDDAAKKLVRLKAESKSIYDEFFGDQIKEKQDEAKIRQIQKKIDKLNDRINSNDFADKIKPKVNDSPEVAEAKKSLAEARDKFKQARNEADPDYENRRHDKFLENYYNKQAEKIRSKIASGDISEKPKKEWPTLSDEAYKAWSERNAAKREWEKVQSDMEYNKASTAYKAKEAVLQWVRGGAISRLGSIVKIAAMAAEELALGPVDRWQARNITGKFAKRLAKESWEAQKSSISDEVKAASMAWKNIRKQAYDMLKSGNNSVDVFINGEKVTLDRGLMKYFGNIHMIEKALIKNPTHALAFEKTLQMMKNNNPDINVNDLMVQHKAWQTALKEANRKILLGDNKAVDLFKRVKAAGKDADFVDVTKDFLIRFLVPVVKVPTNFMLLGLDRTFGLPAGAARYWVDLATKGFDGIKPEEKQRVFRMMNNGFIGGGLFALGWYMYKKNPESIGTIYVPGVKRDQKVHSGQIGNIPSLLLHNPRVAPMLLGATAAQIFDQQIKEKGKDAGAGDVTMALAEAMWASSVGFMEQNPFAQAGGKITDLTNTKGDFSGTIAKTLVNPINPGFLQEASAVYDNLSHGKGFSSNNEMHRVPKGFWENVQMYIPKLRENVPTEGDRENEKRLAPTVHKTKEQIADEKNKQKEYDDKLREELKSEGKDLAPRKSERPQIYHRRVHGK